MMTNWFLWVTDTLEDACFSIRNVALFDLTAWWDRIWRL